MKKIILILGISLVFAFFCKAQTIQTVKDSVLLTITVKADTQAVSIQEMDEQIYLIDQEIDRMTSQLNRLELRKSEYAELKRKAIEILNKPK